MSDESTGTRLSIGITCYPTFGGSGIIATEIGLLLARRGHRVHFISYDVPRRFDRFVDNVFFHAVEVSDYPLFEHTPYAIALASKMVEVSTYEKLDILHVHYAIPHAASAYLARQVLGARAPRVVTTLHGTDITLVGNDPSFLPITRFSILQSDAITVPSAYLRDATCANLDIPRDTEMDVIPNFVDPAAFQPAPSKTWADLAHLFPRLLPGDDGARPPVLVHNSNFRPLKRVDQVVRVLAAVRREVPALLVLIGDGPERSRVERLAHELGLSDAVCFLGKQLDFATVLAQCDVFLLPSETESFGLAALEAMAAGVPVVAARVGGVPEVVADGETGILCDAGDARSMAEAVLALSRDPALHAEMARAARRRAETMFCPEPMVARYEAVYRRALAAPRKG